MTPELATLCKKYCGAVVVSWYRIEYTINAIQMLLEAGVKINISIMYLVKTVLTKRLNVCKKMIFLTGLMQ